MMSSNKVTPSIRFAGFTDTWEQRKFGDQYQKITEKNDLSFGADRIISVANMYFKSEVKQSDDDYMRTYNIMRLGDIAFEGNKSKHFAHGRFVENTIGDGIVSHVFDVFRPIAEYDLLFWKYLINNEGVMGRIMTRCTKASTMMTNLVADDFLAESILVPSIQEQKEIGMFLDKLDTLLTLHQRKCDALQKFKKSMLQKMFPQNGESVPEIRFAGFTDAWEQRKLSDMVERVTRKNENLESELPLTISAQYGLIDQNEFFDKRIASRDVSGYYLLKKGEFAYNKSTSSDAPWGAVKRLDRYEMGVLSTLYIVFALKEDGNIDSDFLVSYYDTDCWHKGVQAIAAEGARNHGLLNITPADYFETVLTVPSNVKEQHQIGTFFAKLDSLITLHQREPPKEDKILNDIKTDTLFHEYYCQWLVIYKEGSVRGVTMQKYHLTAEWVKKLIPDVKLCDFDRITYQQLINDYAETHERQTTMDFHHQLKGAILDAVDDGLIARDPTRKVIIKGKSPNDKKKKYLSRYELQKLLTSLDLNSGLNMDWLILLIAKTGMRFSEAIAVTPMDFDFTHQTLSVNKTWDYKGEGGFQPTKNKSSVRKIRLDWQTVGQFYAIVRELNDTAPIFVSKEKKIYNSTLNDVLERHCKAVGIPTISVHGLRHTHASLLLFDGVSIASVAQRLGHSSINTTQKTYLHIIRELENKDIDLIMKSISSLLD